MLGATTFNYCRPAAISAAAASPPALPLAREMPVTMMRLNLVQAVSARCCRLPRATRSHLPDEVSDTLVEAHRLRPGRAPGSPRAATGRRAPFKTAYDVMNNWGANHGAISYGHIGADLITLCSMLRIPVAMHDVPEDKIYRPGRVGRVRHQGQRRGADFPARAPAVRPAVRNEQIRRASETKIPLISGGFFAGCMRLASAPLRAERGPAVLRVHSDGAFVGHLAAHDHAGDFGFHLLLHIALDGARAVFGRSSSFPRR